MITDASALNTHLTINTDICIVGGGIAGLSLAQELEAKGKQVTLVESGAILADPQTQALYAGSVESDSDHPSLVSSRFRELGGSCVKWGGYCIPFEPADFTSWPMEYAELRAGFEKASQFLEIGSFDFDTIADPGIIPQLKFSEVTKPAFVKISPLINFKEKAKSILVGFVSTQVLVNTNLTQIVRDPTQSRIDHIITKSLSGVTQKIEAKKFILCLGALETVRLLMINNISSQQGVLGQHYTTHYQIKHGYALLKPGINPQLDPFKVGTVTHERLMGFHEAYLKQNKLLNMTLRLTLMSEAEKNKTFPFLKSSKEKLYSIESFIEEPRDDRSRIELSDQVDPLGLAKIKLSHFLKPQMLESLNKVLADLAREFGKAAIGHLQFDTEKPLSKEMIGFFRFHHQGGAVMGKNAQEAVVDSYGKIFDLENLYLNSSAIFPTGGHANPVLTQLALSYRLANHLTAGGANET